MNIDEIVNVLKQGQLAIIPNDTVYGIIGDATNIETIHQVFKIKKRPYTKPLIIMVSNLDMLSIYTKELNDIEKDLISKYWPGPLTILLPKNDKLSDLITSSSPLVAVRIPQNESLLNIINKLNRPIISTSANITGTETITSINELEPELVESIPYIYDGGVIDNASSTIVKVENNQIKILREGSLAEDIKKHYLNN